MSANLPMQKYDDNKYLCVSYCHSPVDLDCSSPSPVQFIGALDQSEPPTQLVLFLNVIPDDTVV